jgi:hypothetical protein
MSSRTRNGVRRTNRKTKIAAPAAVAALKSVDSTAPSLLSLVAENDQLSDCCMDVVRPV